MKIVQNWASNFKSLALVKFNINASLWWEYILYSPNPPLLCVCTILILGMESRSWSCTRLCTRPSSLVCVCTIPRIWERDYELKWLLKERGGCIFESWVRRIYIYLLVAPTGHQVLDTLGGERPTVFLDLRPSQQQQEEYQHLPATISPSAQRLLALRGGTQDGLVGS